MNDICIKLVCTLMMFIVLAGCEKSVEKEISALAIDPMAEMMAYPPEFASLAIEESGGLDAWGKVRQLQLECIVTSYNQDAGYYLTEQKYNIFPWSDSITITGTESRESYKWQLSQGKFSVLKGKGELSSFKNDIKSDCFTEAILNLMIAPVRFMDKSFVYSRDSTAVNIQGKWCYPVTQNTAPKGDSNTSVYYQNKLSSLIDIVLLTCGSNGESFLTCGYDYMEVKDAGISVPNRIEIYKTDTNGIAEKQLFRIDVSSVK